MALTLRAATGNGLDEARTLFREYAEELGVDLGFQGFEAELASLPDAYERIVLAEFGGRLAGCVALKPLYGDVCEIKRLYVRPIFRGRGIARTLVEAMIDEAVALGYRRLRLDTLVRLASAVALYRALGFREIAPYYDNPLPEPVLFMERTL